LVFRLFALAAAVFGVAGLGGHRNNVALGGGMGNVPLVTVFTALVSLIRTAGSSTPLPFPFGKGKLRSE
jgi:hypothetical protein